MYKSYSYNNMPRALTEKPSPPKPMPKPVPTECKKEKEVGFLGDLKNDDIILLIVIGVLLADGCEDKILLAALALVFLGDFF